MKLYHFSESSDITFFSPREAKAKYSLENGVVWAVSDELSWAYCLPRNCPRVKFCTTKETTDEEVELFLNGDSSKKVLAVESGWYERIISTKLYRYEFYPESFSIKDEIAGHYISEAPQKPISVTEISDLLKELFEQNVELRFLPELWDLREHLVKTKLGWGFYRMNNACKPSKNIEYTPV